MQKTLNRAKLAESLRELVAAGCPVDTSVADAEDGSGDVEINQVGESMVFELPYGGTGYILDLEVINQTSRTIYCSEPPSFGCPGKIPFLTGCQIQRRTREGFMFFAETGRGTANLLMKHPKPIGFLAADSLSTRATWSSITVSSHAVF